MFRLIISRGKFKLSHFVSQTGSCLIGQRNLSIDIVQRLKRCQKSSVRYLEPRDVLVLHAMIIDKTGGVHGIRDVGLLISACERPKMSAFGKELCQDKFLKAGCIFESLVGHHVFVDGNKRTAVASAVRFLELNGFCFTGSNAAIERFALQAVVEHTPIKLIAAWLKRHSVQTS